MLPLVVLAGCLERVTGEAIPLDPRFYAGASEANAPAALRPTLGPPWAEYAGATVAISVVLASDTPDAAQVDFWLVDASAPGGQLRIGTLSAAPGEAVPLAVPANVAAFRIEAFQDPDSDGPGTADPWGSADITMVSVIGPVTVALVPGGRGTGGSKQSEAPWYGVESARTTFAGTVTSDLENKVQVDVTEKDAAAEGGQKRVGAVRIDAPGTFTIEVPDVVTEFRLEAFQDLTGDGPSADDAYGDATIARSAFNGGISIALVVGARGVPKEGGGSGSDGAQVPWSAVEGEKMGFVATLHAPSDASVQVDVSELDPAAKGGQKLVGKMKLLPVGGVIALALTVPVAVARFKVECFQDKTGDGPSNDDPYAEALVDVATSAGVAELSLVEGARGRAGSGGGAQTGPDLGDGPKVKVGGAVSTTGTGTITVDVFKVDSTTKAGRSMVTKVEVVGGKWQIQLPVDFGSVQLNAYQDSNGNGYEQSDPQRNYAPSPVVIGSSDLLNLDIALP